MTTDPSQFYTGFVAECYELLVPDDELGTYDFYRRQIREQGGAALEVCCGTGRPLLSFLEAGLDVDGVDSSSDMLAICARKAKQRGLDARIHHQAMQALELERRYRTIFIVSASFQLLPRLADAGEALARFFRHLEPSGRLVLSLEQIVEPPPRSFERFKTFRECALPDGSTLRCRRRTRSFDVAAQVVETALLYQRLRGDVVEREEEHTFVMRWYEPREFEALLEKAGFVSIRSLRPDGRPAESNAGERIVVAEKPAS